MPGLVVHSVLMLFLAMFGTPPGMSKTPACIVAFYVTGCTKKNGKSYPVSDGGKKKGGWRNEQPG